jgi:CRP-like cAMP-binding protein
MTTSSIIDPKKLQGFIPFDYLTAACIEDLTSQFREHALAKGKILFKRGNHDNECHFLINGDIDLADENFNITKITANSKDNYLALDSSSNIHHTSAITTSLCQFYSINRDYLDLVTTWSQLAEDLEEQDPDLDYTDRLDWMDTLLNSPLFISIPPTNIQKLLTRFKEREVRIGEIIVQEGTQGEEFYVIKNGRAIVTQGKDRKEKVLAAIQTGDRFGEDALIAKSVRNATVTMASNGSLMVLDKIDFDKLLKRPVIKSISMAELQLKIDEGVSGTVLIDVRHPQEFRQNRLKNSKNIPLNRIRDKLNTMNNDFHYVVYCDGGRRSEVATYIMTESGFNAVCLTR